MNANSPNSMKKLTNSAFRFALMLAALTPACSTNSSLDSIKTAPQPVLYGVPPVMEVEKGTEIKTKAGLVIVPADMPIHSHGHYLDLLEKYLAKP